MNLFDEDLLNKILDKGIHEMRQSNQNVTSVIFKKEESSQKSEALRNVLNEIKLSSTHRSNEHKFIQNDDSFDKSNNQTSIPQKDSLLINSKRNDMYDLKSEIQLLQSKINGLGKNLFNKSNSLCKSTLIGSKGEESFMKNMKNKKNIDNISVNSNKGDQKNSNRSSKLNDSKSFNNKVNPTSQIKSQTKLKKEQFNLIKSKSSIDIPEYKTYCYREAITVWKEKYYKLMKDDQIVCNALEEERRKNEELNKYKENLETKWNTYDKINYKFNKLIDEYEKLLIRYEESEMIRKEQSKLIKTLKKELELLGKWINPESLNDEDLFID